MIIYFSLLVALVGVLMYALATHGKLIGRLMFAFGLVAFLLRITEAALSIAR